MKILLMVLTGFIILILTNCSKDDFPYAKLGQSKEGGIIIYVDHTGKHGLVAAPYDQSEGIRWNKENDETKAETNKNSLGGGEENTALIVDSFGDGDYAASLCDKLELNGYDDWYLPNTDELNLLYKTKVLVGGYKDAFYWTSDFAGGEPPVYFASSLDFTDSTAKVDSAMLQNIKNRVRAIRAF